MTDEEESRLAKIERRLTVLETRKAVDDERRHYMERRFNSLEQDINDVKSDCNKGFEKIANKVSWVVLIVAGLLITAFVDFALSGGLNAVP